MNKTADRPSIVFFPLAFGGLFTAALCLAALAPTTDHPSDGSSAFDGRITTAGTPGTGSADRSANGPGR